jgi:uracil permease
VNLSETRNIIIVSVTLTMGIGGAALQFGNFTMSGIGLSAIIGVVTNLLLPQTKKPEKEA